MSRSQSNEAGIDVVVRYHKHGREIELDRALCSIFHQSFSPIHLILVVQDFTADEFQFVAELVSEYDWAERHVEPTLVNVEGSKGLDLRSKLLNVGLSKCSMRYVAFLDYDDYLYEHAYEHLIDVSVEDGAVFSFGAASVKHVRVFSRCVYNLRKVPIGRTNYSVRELVDDNLCPIHSFVIDRSAVSPSDLYFNEALTRLEDYDFLLRHMLSYSFSFRGMEKVVCVYNWKVDGSNTIQQWEADDVKKRNNEMQWDTARRHIWKLKTKVRDRLGLFGAP